jgi:hypothetical protein
MKDSPEILAQKLRRAVDQKKYAEQAVSHYMKQLRMAYPDLNQALDQIDQCADEIERCREELDRQARAGKKTLSFPGLGVDVKFSNPMSKKVNFDDFVQAVPNWEQYCPELVKVERSVDMKNLEAYVDAGRLPETIKAIIVQVPTTKEGAVKMVISET